MKTMGLNQEKLMAYHAKDMRSMYTKLEKWDEELDIMKVNHFNQVVAMQKHLIIMKENHDKVIRDMEINV